MRDYFSSLDPRQEPSPHGGRRHKTRRPHGTTRHPDRREPRLAPEAFAERAQAIEHEVGRVIVGQRDLVRQTLTGLLADGHVLLEGVPGLGKTMLVRTLADVIDCTFNRIQFTPDLMPADIIGTNILIEEGGQRDFEFQPGPIFANLVLADEINRATPKTQSACSRRCRSTRSRSPASAPARAAVLRAGDAEPARDGGDLSAARGAARPVPLQADGPLPDRGGPRSRSSIARPAPRRDAPQGLHGRRDRRDAATRPGSARSRPHVTAYAVSLLAATHPDEPARPARPRVRPLRRLAARRAGPRDRGQDPALLDGRFNVSTDDIRALALPSLRHRIILNFEGEAEGITTEATHSDDPRRIAPSPTIVEDTRP